MNSIAKRYALRRGYPGARLLATSGFWTNNVEDIRRMTLADALTDFYERVQNDFPKRGLVSERGLEIVEIVPSEVSFKPILEDK